MLPFYLSTISPYIRDKTRLFLIHSGSDYGDLTQNDYISRLESYVQSVNSEQPYIYHDFHRTRSYPTLGADRVRDSLISDLVLSDTFRQNKSIEERYRKNLVNSTDIRSIFDANYKFHLAMSRGMERHILRFIGDLDGEMVNRKTIVPLII